MADINVSNKDALIKAFANAKAGDRILLAPGNYGAISFKNKSFASDVTIASANAGNPAKFDSFKLYNVSHVALTSVEVGHTLATGESRFTKFVDVLKSNHITFDKLYVHGSLDNNPGNDGYGIGINNVQFVKITNSRFEQLGRGTVFSSSSDIVLQGNAYSNMRTDGADFGDVQRVLVDNNTFKDFYPTGGDHPDAIQFTTAGTTRPSTDIVVSNNQIFQGKGLGVQGIFFRDQVGTLPYQNVKIINNLGYSWDQYNGINVGGGVNVEVSGNTFVSGSKDDKNFIIRLTNVKGGIVKNNVADLFVTSGNTGLNVTGNKFLLDDRTFGAKIKDLNALSAAKVSGLIVTGIGYQSNGVKPSTATGYATEEGGSVQTATSFSADSFAPAGLASAPAAVVQVIAPVISAAVAPAPAPAFTLPSVLAAAPIVPTSAALLASLKSIQIGRVDFAFG
jgi:Right handed beta helix region